MKTALQLLRELSLIDTVDCIEWPMARHPSGYGKMWDGAQIIGSHRAMCFLVYGPPPTPEHEAAHSCANRPCVNKRHLKWKTHLENQADMIEHGHSLRGERHHRALLAEEDIHAIRRLLAMRCSHSQIAQRYGVKRQTITNISTGHRWAHLEEPKT